MLHYSLQAARQLANEGVGAEVIDVRSLSPIDLETIGASVQKTGRVVIVEEGPKTGSVSAEIAASIMEHFGESLRCPIRRVASADVPCAVHAGAGERLPPRRAADRPGGARGHAILNQEVAPWKRMHRFVPAAALSSARPWSPHWVDCSSGLTRRSPVPTSLSTPGVSCLRDGHVQSAHWHQCDAVLCAEHPRPPAGRLSGSYQAAISRRCASLTAGQ